MVAVTTIFRCKHETQFHYAHQSKANRHIKVLENMAAVVAELKPSICMFTPYVYLQSKSKQEAIMGRLNKLFSYIALHYVVAHYAGNLCKIKLLQVPELVVVEYFDDET